VRPLIAALAAACLCTACLGSLLESDAKPPSLYRLAGPSPASGADRLPRAITITRPGAAPSLDTDRIAVLKPDHGFDYLTGARWADAAPEMLQQLVVGALASGFTTAVAAPSRVPTELMLYVQLRHFEARYTNVDAPPVVNVAMQATLVEPGAGIRLTSFEVGAEVTAARNDRRAVVAAFESATDEVVTELVRRVREAAARP
jgi:cholesterol transport system auxiliary component